MENNSAGSVEVPGEDLSLLCLTCSGPSGPNSVSLLDYKELREVLSQHFGVTLDGNSNLPLQVCATCYASLHDVDDNSRILSTEEVLHTETNESLPDLESSKVIHILLDMKENNENSSAVTEPTVSSDQLKSIVVTVPPINQIPAETLHCVISQSGTNDEVKDNNESDFVDLVPLDPNYNDETTYNLEEEIFTGCEQTEDEIASFIVSIPSDYEDNLEFDSFNKLDKSKESNNSNSRRKQTFSSVIRNEEPHFEYRKISNQNKCQIDCINLSDSSNDDDDVVFLNESQVKKLKKKRGKGKMKKIKSSKVKNANKTSKEI